MRIIYLAIIVSCLSCHQQESQPARIDIEEPHETFDLTNTVGSPCYALDSSQLITTENGSIIKYTRIDDMEYSVSWGRDVNNLRTLPDKFYCDTPNGSKPRFIDESDNYIVLENSCGNPCWQGFFLPLKKHVQPQVIGMFYDYDLNRDLVIYPETDSIGSYLSLKNILTNSIQVIELPKKCDSPVEMFCIDSIAILKNDVYYRYDPTTLGKVENMLEKRIKLQ